VFASDVVDKGGAFDTSTASDDGVAAGVDGLCDGAVWAVAACRGVPGRVATASVVPASVTPVGGDVGTPLDANEPSGLGASVTAASDGVASAAT